MIWELDRFSSRLEHEASVLWRSGTDGGVLLMASAHAVAVMLVLVLAYPILRSRAPLVPAPLAFALLTTSAMLGSCFWLITRVRQSCLTLGPWDPIGAAARRYYADPSSSVELAVKFVGISLLAISLAWMIVVLLAPASPMCRALTIVCALLVSTTVWVALDHRVTFPWNANYDPEGVHLSLLEEMAEAQQRVAGWQAKLAAAALVGFVICLAVSLREARRGRPMTNRGALGAALLLVLGAASFAATRAAAADVRLPIPHVPVDERCYADDGVLPPISKGCVAMPGGPVVELPGPQRHLKELGYSSVNAILSSEQGFIERIAVKRLWMQINPGRQFPGSIGLAVASDVRIASIDFAQIHAIGYHRVFLLMHSPRTQVKTDTIGAVWLWGRCCALEIRLDPQGEPAKNYTTYGDLVRAANDAAQSGRLLDLAP